MNQRISRLAMLERRGQRFREFEENPHHFCVFQFSPFIEAISLLNAGVEWEPFKGLRPQHLPCLYWEFVGVNGRLCWMISWCLNEVHLNLNVRLLTHPKEFHLNW